MVVVVVCCCCGVVMTLNAPTVPPKAPDSKRSGATPVLRAIGATSHIFGAPRTLRARRAC